MGDEAYFALEEFDGRTVASYLPTVKRSVRSGLFTFPAGEKMIKVEERKQGWETRRKLKTESPDAVLKRGGE